jgi:hypothetical protein
MQISGNMNVHQVQEMMGTEATHEEALAMVEFLIVGDYTDTDQIGSDEWLGLCAFAADGVARNAELSASRSQ